MKKNNMNGQSAFVCGASKGIGAATAIELSKKGVSTILLARDNNRLDDIMNILDSNVYSGLEANVKFNNWKKV